MLRILSAALVMFALVPAGCQPSAGTVDPNDPAITAVIDSLLTVVSDGAARVDVDRVLEPAAGPGELTFVTEDVVLTGFELIRERFGETYSGLLRQDQTIIEKRIRVLSPDVAIAIFVAEGTYTDKAGWTSEPVGIGTTIVFVKANGRWQIQHAHQSISK
jgi:uncharacterized protein (TIGR02246 family)